MPAIFGECKGKTRSTATPKEFLRTVNVSPMPLPLRWMQRPSKFWMRSRLPSMTRYLTRTVSPARNAATSDSIVSFVITFISSRGWCSKPRTRGRAYFPPPLAHPPWHRPCYELFLPARYGSSRGCRIIARPAPPLHPTPRAACTAVGLRFPPAKTTPQRDSLYSRARPLGAVSPHPKGPPPRSPHPRARSRLKRPPPSLKHRAPARPPHRTARRRWSDPFPRSALPPAPLRNPAL